jgi:hypothetical protein
MTEEVNVKKFNTTEFATCIDINRSDLATELSTNPANLAYYIEQAARWSAQVDLAKTLRDNRAAEIYIELKDSGSKVTDGYISATQQLDETHKKYVTALRNAREQLALYEGAVTALEKKQFSLGALNANVRTEQESSSSHGHSTSEDRAERRARIVDAVR